MTTNKRPHCKPDKPDVLPITDNCCTGTTGCEWDGTLRNIVAEPGIEYCKQCQIYAKFTKW